MKANFAIAKHVILTDCNLINLIIKSTWNSNCSIVSLVTRNTYYVFYPRVYFVNFIFQVSSAKNLIDKSTESIIFAFKYRKNHNMKYIFTLLFIAFCNSLQAQTEYITIIKLQHGLILVVPGHNKPVEMLVPTGDSVGLVKYDVLTDQWFLRYKDKEGYADGDELSYDYLAQMFKLGTLQNEGLTAPNKVYICDDFASMNYHSIGNCIVLSKCINHVIPIGLAKALRMNRRSCDMCSH